MATTPKYKVSSIEITRIEGPEELCNVKWEFQTFAEANALLNAWRVEGLEHSDRCDYKVVWDDPKSQCYEGYYYLNHADEKQSLNDRVRFMANFYAGFFRPESYDDQAWAAHQRNIASTKEHFEHLLTHFEM